MPKRNLNTDFMELPADWKQDPEVWSSLFVLNLKQGETFNLGTAVSFTVKSVSKSQVKLQPSNEQSIIIKHCGYGMTSRSNEINSTGTTEEPGKFPVEMKEEYYRGFYTGQGPAGVGYNRSKAWNRYKAFLRDLHGFIAVRIMGGDGRFYGTDERFIISVINRDFMVGGTL